jgi:NAD(P)-dependent dehydrogenase (short-subunit alcohol dehydrogenase family)
MSGKVAIVTAASRGMGAAVQNIIIDGGMVKGI